MFAPDLLRGAVWIICSSNPFANSVDMVPSLSLPCRAFATGVGFPPDRTAHRDHISAMWELIRDPVFGRLIRFLSNGKLLPYAEDNDPGL